MMNATAGFAGKVAADEPRGVSMVDETVATFGRLDAAVNSAAVMQHGVNTADITPDE